VSGGEIREEALRGSLPKAARPHALGRPHIFCGLAARNTTPPVIFFAYFPFQKLQHWFDVLAAHFLMRVKSSPPALQKLYGRRCMALRRGRREIFRIRPLGIAALSSHHPSVIWSPPYSLEREENNSGGRILKHIKILSNFSH